MKSFTPVKSINITSRLLDAQDSKDNARLLNLELKLQNIILLLTLLIIVAKILI